MFYSGSLPDSGDNYTGVGLRINRTKWFITIQYNLSRFEVQASISFVGRQDIQFISGAAR